MRYWYLLAGHREREPGKTRSAILGDWLRRNCISIGWEESTPPHGTFRNEMRVGDKVIAYADKHVWAIGTITGEVEEPRRFLHRAKLLYPYTRSVEWDKITKIGFRKFPKEVIATGTIHELSPQEWETFVIYLMRLA